MELIGMELVPKNEVFDTDRRNTKKMLLPTDAVCIQCGIIFNAFYAESCVMCDDEDKKGEGIIREEIIKIIKEEEEKDNICEHKEFIFGRQSVDLRVLLDYNVEDLRALCELHGCSEGSRAKMTINILKKLHPTLDKRISETLIRKMLFRNRKKFRYWRDIETAVSKAKKVEKIKIVKADECIEIKDLNYKNK